MSEYITIGRYLPVCSFEDFGSSQRSLLMENPKAEDIWDTIVFYRKDYELSQLVAERATDDFFITPEELIDWLVENKEYIYKELDIPYEAIKEQEETTTYD